MSKKSFFKGFIIPLAAIPIIIILMVLSQCSGVQDSSYNSSSYTRLNSNSNLYEPSISWVGKTVEITFSSRAVKALRNKTFIVTLKSVETDLDGYKYFKTVKPFTNKEHDFLYFTWFGDMIESYREI